MKQLYTNKIFNWALLVLSVIICIEKAISLFQGFEFFNILILKIFLLAIPVFSILSFWVGKISKEFFSKLFLLVFFIVGPSILFYHYLVDLIIYSISRTILISNPKHFLKFFMGIVLFYFSIKFSRTTKIEQQMDFGKMFLVYGFFLVLLNFSSFFDPENFNWIEFFIKFLISFVIMFFANNLRLKKMKFLIVFIFCVFLTIIYDLI